MVFLINIDFISFRCDASYTEEEMSQLGELVNGIAHTECFMKIFKESCGSYVKNTIASLAGPITTMAGRK